jgi:RNA polymerase II subunit A small phosphatase-like protein
MADRLVAQVHQEDDPVKQQEEAKRLAEKARGKKPTDVEENPQRSGCWNIFSCFFSRKQDTPVARKLDPTASSLSSVEDKSLLGPPKDEHKGRKTLVLDLDETLIHSSFRPVPGPDYIVSIELEGVTHKVYVQKRPGVDEFLEAVATKFEVVIFTASLDMYANPVIDHLDTKRVCSKRLFRESCVQHYGTYVKDLSLLGRDLKQTLIIDNSPYSYMFQPDNAIPITSWFNDKADRELYELVPFLNSTIADAEDVSRVIVEKKQLAMQIQPEPRLSAQAGGDEEQEEEQGDAAEHDEEQSR